MASWLIAFYEHAEAYAVLLTAIVVPLGFYVLYTFLRNHYGLLERTDKDYGTDR